MNGSGEAILILFTNQLYVSHKLHFKFIQHEYTRPNICEKIERRIWRSANGKTPEIRNYFRTYGNFLLNILPEKFTIM